VGAATTAQVVSSVIALSAISEVSTDGYQLRTSADARPRGGERCGGRVALDAELERRADVEGIRPGLHQAAVHTRSTQGTTDP
jgi:hypothetical protein